jgi:two-component system KDP operon response regulator KdpE
MLGALTILIADDDRGIRRMLTTLFEPLGCRTIEAESGQVAVQAIATKRPDVILLDMYLGDMSGLEIVQKVREWSSIPILMLSASGDEEVKVQCLEAGADDYITKPFGLAELQARIKVALRNRSGGSADEPVFDNGAVKIDYAARRVWVRDAEIHLTPLEYRLLTALSKNAGRVLTSRQLLTEVWGPEYAEEAQNLRVYVSYLRKKVEEDPDQPSIVLTDYGVGYRLGN